MRENGAQRFNETLTVAQLVWISRVLSTKINSTDISACEIYLCVFCMYWEKRQSVLLILKF